MTVCVDGWLGSLGACLGCVAVLFLLFFFLSFRLLLLFTHFYCFLLPSSGSMVNRKWLTCVWRAAVTVRKFLTCRRRCSGKTKKSGYGFIQCFTIFKLKSEASLLLSQGFTFLSFTNSFLSSLLAYFFPLLPARCRSGVGTAQRNLGHCLHWAWPAQRRGGSTARFTKGIKLWRAAGRAQSWEYIWFHQFSILKLSISSIN